MIVHDLRVVRLGHDGHTLYCDRCHRALTESESDAAWARFGNLSVRESVDALGLATRLDRWPVRWLVRAWQSVDLRLRPPECLA